MNKARWLRHNLKLFLAVLLITLVGCGSGANNTDQTSQSNSGFSGSAESTTQTSTSSQPNTESQPSASLTTASSAAEASRFLGQTTFGPTVDSIENLTGNTYTSWLHSQFNLPVTSMRAAFDVEQSLSPDAAPNRDWIFELFWQHAVTADDQLRQRMAFALSQIFVISLRDGGVASSPRGAADFYSRLATHAFGNFRTLLEEVTLHPMMGLYLSHLGNEKGDLASGRVPDENFAREVMQLFTIGLTELNADGSPRLSADNKPIDTYKTSDVQGLARVFTGFSWNGPDKELGRFQGWIPAPDRDILLMQAYPDMHSTKQKTFLGTTIAQSNVADPPGDLQVALDALFNHPNVGPFISKQLIQRLVSSNPSAAYIERVASAFNDNGQGVRGDMKAVLTAILIDSEARSLHTVNQQTSGRLREPILRFAHWMRSFNATSVSGRYKILGTDDPATSLGMTVLRSPSVFNFYRPGYVPPQTPIADANLVSPEMQITHQTSVAGYLNSMLATIEIGGGFNYDIKTDFPYSLTLADDTQALINHVDLLLTHGAMSVSLNQLIADAVDTIVLSQGGSERQAQLLKRVQIAVTLAMSSPEYIVQK